MPKYRKYSSHRSKIESMPYKPTDKRNEKGSEVDTLALATEKKKDVNVAIDDGITSEDLIVIIAQERRKDAFAELFVRFAPKIKAFMYKSGADETTCEELVQETMLQVWRKADRYNPEKAAASTWIMTVCRNLRIDRIRKLKRYEIDVNDPTLVTQESPDTEAIVAGHQKDEEVRKAMESLSVDQRKVVMLSFYEGLAHREIAEKLDIPLGTVKSRMRLAFQ